MEEDLEHFPVVEICKKSLFSETSSEGHFRRHFPENSGKKLEDCNFREISEMGVISGDENRFGFRENLEKVSRVSDSTHTLENSKNSDLGLEDSCDGSYGLREKSRRGLYGKRSFEGEENCSECRKGFLSLGALTAHLRSHLPPKREIICKECGKRFGSLRALCGHMKHHPKVSRTNNESVPKSQSDYEMIPCPVRKKRSKMSYNISSSSNMSSAPNVEEEAAMGLLMLSTGWGSSENEAVGGSSGGRLRFDACKSWKVKKMRQKGETLVQSSGYSLSERNEPEFDELGCGLIRNNTKEAEVIVFVDGFREVEESKKPDLVVESMEVTSSSETDNALMKTDEFKHVDEAEIDNGIECIGEGLDFYSSKEDRSGVHSLEMVDKVCVRTTLGASDYENFKECQKVGEYKCRTCDEVFYSYPALVAHQAIHKTSDILVHTSHMCQICLKVFPSYQALGGHKRAHYAVISETECQICLKVFPSSQALEGHKRAHHVSKAETKCPICFKVFPSSQALGGHKRHHVPKSETKCPICFKVFPSSQALGCHKRVHSVAISESKAEESMLKEYEVSSDLGLPARMMNMVASRSCGGIGSDLKHMSVLISN